MERTRFSFFILCLIFYYFPSYANEQDGKINSFFTEKATYLKLYEDPQWQKILFYQKKYFSGKRDIVDGIDFYLSPEGNRNPAKELNTTLETFLYVWPYFFKNYKLRLFSNGLWCELCCKPGYK